MAWDDSKNTFQTRPDVPADEKLTSAEWNTHVSDQQRGKTSQRVDVTSTTYTAAAQDSIWVDTAAAGGAVTITLPADANTFDGQRVEVGVEDATNNTDVSPNSNQTIIGTNPTLTAVGETLTFEYKSATSTWMVR